MAEERDSIWLGGNGGDVFGEVGPGRNIPNDPNNTFLRTMYLKEYFQTAASKGALHEDFGKDMMWFQTSFYQKLAYASAGVMFAGVIFNPNYTSRHSFYMRKLTPIFFGMIGWQWGKKKSADQLTNLMLKNYDYYPRAVRRTLETKDHRHMIGFDFDKVRFDPKTGKCLE